MREATIVVRTTEQERRKKSEHELYEESALSFVVISFLWFTHENKN